MLAFEKDKVKDLSELLEYENDELQDMFDISKRGARVFLRLIQSIVDDEVDD